MFRTLAVTLAFAIATPAFAQTAPAPKPGKIERVAPAGGPAIVAAPTPAPAPCDVTSLDSPPAKAWLAQQSWRYATPADAATAYLAIVNGQSPWPNWFTGAQSMLPVGTRFQMAMSPGQGEDKPGGFGTFDNILNAQDVREYLAVQSAWKPVIDKVVTYEVIHALPVQTGPVGPQVDPKLCALLPGRWSQFQMLVAPADRIWYIKAIEVRPIQ